MLKQIVKGSKDVDTGDLRLSLLLPVHNEVATIEKVIRGFYEEISCKFPVEIIVAEDGSTDGTKEVLQNLAKQIHLNLILSEERKGYMKAIKDGLEAAHGDYVLFSDSDGQHDPSDVWKLFALINTYDIVGGWRFQRADSSQRRLISYVFQTLSRLVFRLPFYRDITAPLRLVKTPTAKRISRDVKYMDESYWTEFTIRAHKAGQRITEVPVSHNSRLGGVSTQVYRPKAIPRIVASQLADLFRLWLELRGVKGT